MSLTHEQIERIRNRSPGWEEDWRQLCVLLLGHDAESGALVRAVKALPVTWPTARRSADFEDGGRREGTERDDFIAEKIGQYHRRAHAGTLLVGYDPTLGDVVAFLTSRQMLYCDANRFLSILPHRKPKEERIVVSLDEVAEPDEKGGHAQWTDAATQREFEDLIGRIQGELQKNIEKAKRITRIVEQAGIQLYPRLDWSRSAMAPLREHLSNTLRSSVQGGDPLETLQRAHEAAKQRFARRLDKLAARVDNSGKGVSRRKRELLEERISRVRFERFLLPISHRTLTKLLGITTPDAAQRRSRYRRSVPDLLPGVRADYEALTRQW